MNHNRMTAFLAGVAAGVGIGMLATSKTGEQLRQRLKTTTDDGIAYVKKQGSALKNSAARVMEEGSQTADRVKETVGEAVSAGKQAYTDALLNASTRADLRS